MSWQKKDKRYSGWYLSFLFNKIVNKRVSLFSIFLQCFVMKHWEKCLQCQVSNSPSNLEHCEIACGSSNTSIKVIQESPSSELNSDSSNSESGDLEGWPGLASDGDLLGPVEGYKSCQAPFRNDLMAGKSDVFNGDLDGWTALAPQLRHLHLPCFQLTLNHRKTCPWGMFPTLWKSFGINGLWSQLSIRHKVHWLTSKHY